MLSKRYTLIAAFLLASCAMEGSIPQTEYRYVPIGDSYTIGHGLPLEDSYPEKLAAALRTKGFNIRVAENPAISGFTVADALEHELKTFEEIAPTFATVMIGSNDVVQGTTEEQFRSRFSELLDRMIAAMPENGKMLILTAPDFSKTATGLRLGVGKNLPDIIRTFNDIVQEEAKKRGLPVVDIEPITSTMFLDPRRVIDDGLHPSATEYERWAEEILPAADRLLRQATE